MVPPISPASPSLALPPYSAFFSCPPPPCSEFPGTLQKIMEWFRDYKVGRAPCWAYMC